MVATMVSKIVVLILALAALALGACGDDDEGDESGAAPSASSLPTGDELELDEGFERELDEATDVTTFLVVGGATDPDELGATIDDAGFEEAVSKEFSGNGVNVRMVAVQFDSDEGALEARDLLHEEDLKSPCPDKCIVTPLEYELDDVPDSAAAHHVPNEDDGPVEAHHAEFVIGSTLYAVQMDGKPSQAFSGDFDELMQRVHDSALSVG